MMSRWPVALLLVALGACGEESAAGPGSQSGVIDLAGGGKRVTLTGNYLADLNGQGWDVTAGRITPDEVGSDFHVAATMVVQLTFTEQPAGFCRKQPAGGGTLFARLEDVPGDTAGCNWTSAQLGGNSDHDDSQWAGQGYLFRDRAGAVAARLMIVDDYVIAGDFGVTFDIIGL
jgi:hypothetical protein